MMTKSNHTSFPYWEILFQLLLHGLVFLFFSFDRRNPQIEMHQFVFFLNYALAAFVLNYYFLPRFFYKKQYWQFFVAVVAILITVIVVEEMVLEKWYFPDTRGTKFSPILYTLIDVAPIIAILTGFKFAWDAIHKQDEVDELKAAVRDSELQFLKSQINPHFLFNNLNNLYAYAIENSPKTPEIILELAGVLRYMLYECKAEYVALAKEIKQLENFMRLSELQIEERGSVTFTKNNIQAGYQIAPLILVVFIENAFKHSMASQTEEIFIEVKVELLSDGKLFFICKNSYLEQSNNDNISHGIGLENVQKRLELLYPNSHDLNISRVNQMHTVELTLKLSE
ncbi:MAG: sensor histidine kinase [Saprospiraceae bacterium]